MRETFLQRLLHAADSLRELFPLSGEDVCLWLSIGLVDGIVNGGGCGHMGSFLSWAPGGFVYCRQDGLRQQLLRIGGDAFLCLSIGHAALLVNDRMIGHGDSTFLPCGRFIS